MVFQITLTVADVVKAAEEPGMPATVSRVHVDHSALGRHVRRDDGHVGSAGLTGHDGARSAQRHRHPRGRTGDSRGRRGGSVARGVPRSVLLRLVGWGGALGSTAPGIISSGREG